MSYEEEEEVETNGIRFSDDQKCLIIGRPYVASYAVRGVPNWMAAGQLLFDEFAKHMKTSPHALKRIKTWNDLHKSAVAICNKESNTDPDHQVSIPVDEIPGRLVSQILNDEETAKEVQDHLLRYLLRLEPGDHPLKASLRSIDDVYLAVRLLQQYYGDGPNLEVKKAGRWMPVRVSVSQRNSWSGHTTRILGQLLIGDREESCCREITATVFENEGGVMIRRSLGEVLLGPGGGWYSDEFRPLDIDTKDWQRQCQSAIDVSVPGAVFKADGIALLPVRGFYGGESLKNFYVAGEMVVAEPEMESEQRRRDPWGDEVEGTPTAFVRCFHLGRKEYIYLHVDDLKEYDWEANALDNLVLPGHMQNILRAVFATDPSEMFGDVLQARSGGMVIEACGSTGVGKTLTAEIFAQHHKRPLYVMEIGELGTNLNSIEENLVKIFERAERWNAVLLLDEADVFLAKRGLDLERSAIVGVFLRLLDYFRGIIFLTTNRSNIIDPAFASRVTIRLDYPYLTEEVRGNVWDILLAKAQMDVNGTPEERKVLMEMPFNGRQIRNIVRLTRIVAGGSKTSGVAETTWQRLIEIGRYQPITDDARQADQSDVPVVGDLDGYVSPVGAQITD